MTWREGQEEKEYFFEEIDKKSSGKYPEELFKLILQQY